MNLHDTKSKKVILQAYGKPVTNLAVADFSIAERQFIIKNDNADRVLLEVKYFCETAWVSTYFQPGWNPDILIAIKQNALISNLLYSE